MLNAFRARGDTHDDVDDYAETLEDPNANVVAQIEAQQQGDLLRGCIEELNEAQRECIQLVFFEGMALAEIASVQAVPEGP
ncbi:MAG: sigma factor-like helix-turn-helix DNA-binding protein [Burkholderiaceae bacterium]